MSTESELILDDGTKVVLDGAYSPAGQDPDPGRVSRTHLLLIDDALQEELEGKVVVGWRWRINNIGGSPEVYRPDDEVEFHFVYEFSDCNCNGISDAEELRLRMARDCNENDVPDSCDIAAGTAPDSNGDGVIDGCAVDAFRRGDCNDDGGVDMSDAICILGWLFLGDSVPGCVAVTNTNGDDAADLTDAVYLLGHLFLGGPAPVLPFPECGPVPVGEASACETPPASCQ